MTSDVHFINFSLVPGLHIAKLPPITKSWSEWGTIGHKIHKIYVPVDWDLDPMYHDLAIVIVTIPFAFNEKIAPIKLDFRPQHLKGLCSQAWC